MNNLLVCTLRNTANAYSYTFDAIFTRAAHEYALLINAFLPSGNRSVCTRPTASEQCRHTILWLAVKRVVLIIALHTATRCVIQALIKLEHEP